MCWLKTQKLGARTLRFKDRGRDVDQLHEFLRSQGYDLGKEKDFGYLTKDAVRQFQREHGLIADGIAGRRFFALILSEDLPIRRQVHVVQPGETFQQIAENYGLQPQAFGLRFGKRQAYPGQRLLFFHREVWGIYSDPLASPTESHQLTGLVDASKDAASSDLPTIVQTQQGQNLFQIHKLLKSRGKIKATVDTLIKEAAGYQGLYLPWTELAAVDGSRYLRLLRRLRKNLAPSKMLWVELGPGVPSWKVWGGLDYGAVNQLVDRIVLSLPPPLEPEPVINPEKLEKALNLLGPEIYTWKVLIKLPVYGHLWELAEEGAQCKALSYRTALSRAFRHGARLTEDERGLFYQYQSRGRQFQLWVPQYRALNSVLAMINRLNTAGLILDGLGQEDPRIWEVLTAYFRPAQL